MRKFAIIVMLICALAFCLVSCNNSNNNNNSSTTNNSENTYTPPEKTPAQKAMDLINTITDADSCYEAAKAFYTLSKSQQEEVPSSTETKLKMSMNTYASDTRIRDYLMEEDAESASTGFHNQLRNRLLNIDSYSVNSQTSVVFYDETTDTYYLYLKIDYSAQNQAGGYNRYENNAEYYVWKNNFWSRISSYSFEDFDDYLALLKKIYTWEFEEYDRYYFTYRKTN